MKVAQPANLVWHNMLSDISKYGEHASPRGLDILEMLGYRTVIDMRYPIVTNPARSLGYKFQAAEAAWILSGSDHVEGISRFSKEISKFSDDGIKFFGAYGPKIQSQISYVADTLINDQESRQAVINIWRENPRKTKDVPCTLSLQFVIRKGMLHCIASMRSSDAWLGWPYDVFNFSMVSIYLIKYMATIKPAMARLLLGNLYLTAGSQHLYESNFTKVADCLKNPGAIDYKPINPTTFISDYIEGVAQELWTVAELDGTLKWRT